MSTLTEQRCFNHLSREAVARCPQCKRHFCRECVTEHEGRVLCSACLNTLQTPRKKERHWRAAASLVGHCAVAFVIVWAAFYYVGQLLLMLPSAFHDGALWRDVPWNNL